MQKFLLFVIFGYHLTLGHGEPQTMPPPAPPPVCCKDQPKPPEIPTTANADSQSYGTFTPGRETLRGWSFFTTLEENACRLPIALMAVAGPTVGGIDGNFTRAAFEKAVVSWSSLLAQNQSYACRDGVAVEWLTSPKAAPAITVYIDPAVERSYAIVGQYEIRLSPRYATGTDFDSEKVILHEMGHMAGLSDTYTEPGYQQPIGQPDGIMNNLYQVPWLTLDDAKGVNALYEYMNGRGVFCDDGYKVGGAYENRNNVAFCVPL